VDNPNTSRTRRYILAAVVFVAVFALDLWSKQWAWDHLRGPDGRTVVVWEHVFYLRYGFNTGSAFSLLREADWARMFFIIITFVALGYMAWLLKTMPNDRAYGFAAVAMIAAGAAGNLHDRFVRVDLVNIEGQLVERHGVVDFLQFYYDWDGGNYWPIFNVADSGLVCGVFLLLIYLHKQGKIEQAEAEAKAAAEAATRATAGNGLD